MSKSILNIFAIAAAVFALAGPPAGAAERVAKPAAAVLPPFEIITIVRSAGFNPLTRPTRHGTNYQLRAVDEDGQQVSVMVDGRLGEVISVTPVALGPRDRMREYDPVRPSVYDSGSPLYEPGPPVYRRAPPIIIEEEPEPPMYRRTAPLMPPAVVPPSPEREAVVVPPDAVPDVVIEPRPSPPAYIPSPSPPPPPATVVSVPPSGGVMPEPEGDGRRIQPGVDRVRRVSPSG